jgi:hypothetical protein
MFEHHLGSDLGANLFQISIDGFFLASWWMQFSHSMLSFKHLTARTEFYGADLGNRIATADLSFMQIRMTSWADHFFFFKRVKGFMSCIWIKPS